MKTPFILFFLCCLVLLSVSLSSCDGSLSSDPDSSALINQNALSPQSLSAFVVKPDLSLSQLMTIKKSSSIAQQIMSDESWTMSDPTGGSGTIMLGTPISTNRTDLAAPDGGGTYKQDVPRTDGINPITSIQFTSSAITARDANGGTVLNYTMDAEQAQISQVLNSQANQAYQEASQQSLQKGHSLPSSPDELVKYWQQKGYTVKEVGGKRYELSRASMPNKISHAGMFQGTFSVTMVFNANTMKMESGSTSHNGKKSSEVFLEHGLKNDEPVTLRSKMFLDYEKKGRKDIALFTTRKIAKNKKGGGK